MAKGIRDKVAILGMGCSKFGERWDMNAEDLMVEAYVEALADAGIETKQIDAAWLATAIEEQHVGKSAIPLAVALRLPYIPVTRVENYCASGTEAFRGAVYAVASGAADIALALGVEKLKDTGYGGLPQRGRGTLNNMTWPNASAPGSFAQLAAAYRAKHGSAPEDLKRAMGHISVKSHDNGAKNPKAHLRNRITLDTVLNAPMVAEPLGLYDCCGVSDGSACAIVTTPDIAKGLGKRDVITVKALQLARLTSSIPLVVGDEKAAESGSSEVSAFVPGTSETALRTAVEHGMRITLPMLLMSTRDFGSTHHAHAEWRRITAAAFVRAMTGAGF